MKIDLILLLFASGLFAGACYEKERSPEVFELPWGFEGWVEVEYQREDCPPLLKRNGKRVVQISSEGAACTSSEYELGVARDAYYWVGDERQELELFDRIWPGGTFDDETPTRVFFVGSKKQLDEFGNPWDLKVPPSEGT